MRFPAFVLALLLLLAAGARADSIADEADFRFHRAATLYRQGKVEDALGEFLASNRLVRNRNVIFNIARCFEQLSKFNEAYRWYTEIQGDEMPAEDRKELQLALKRLQPSLALLRVDSAPPGATVYIDRKDLGGRGQTPVTLALPAGKAQVILELDGFRPFQQPVQPQVGKTVEVKPALDRIYGEVVVEGEPEGFELRVDAGSELNAPALQLLRGRAKVIPGRHILTVTAPGHAAQQLAVEVTPDSVTPVKFKLLPLPPPSGGLVVRANLEGALIRVDGKELGFTPGVVDNVVEGTHKVEVLADGREPVIEDVVIKRNERSFVDVKLRYALPRVVAAEKELTRAQDAPASITVITGDEIRGFGYTTLAEALQGVRGLYTTYDREYPTLGVRGFSSPGTFNSRVLVLSDGHVTNESAIGQGYVGHDFDADLSDVERIEVVRGPGSVLYGSAAFFAVVNVVHKTPARGVHASVGGTVGTLGEDSGHASASLAGEESYVWARASGLDMSGERFFVDPGTDLIARDQDQERAGHVDLRAKAGGLTLLASYNTRKKLLPTGAFSTIFDAPGTSLKDTRGFVEALYDHTFASGLGFDLRASYDGERYVGSWQYIGRALGTLGSDTSTEDWVTGELRLRLPEWKGHRFFLGSEVQDRFHVDLTSYVPADTSGRHQSFFSNYDDGMGLGPATPGLPNSELVMSGYLGDDWRISRRVQLDLAVRVDKYVDNYGPESTQKEFDPAVNPRLALLVNAYDAGHTKLLFGRAFRAPGFYERYFNDNGTTQIAANNLQPETVYTAELEHSHQVTDEVSVLVSGYLSEMRNLIRVGSPTGNADLLQYQNRPFKVHAAGAEAEVRWQAGPGWLFSAWYAWSVVRDDGQVEPDGTVSEFGWFRGTEVPNSPQHTGAVRLLYPLIQGALSISTEVVYNSPRRAVQNDDGSFGNLIGEALFWNLGISGEYAPFGLRYGAFVNNLLNERPSFPAGAEVPLPDHSVAQYGRMLRLQLSASF